MSFLTMLYTLLLKPLHLIYEFIFNITNQLTNNPGLTIIILSLIINILILPLYNRADLLQKEENDKKASLNKWVTHIKKSFHGDERTMMLQIYYRQNNYSPFSMLRGMVSLLLEIPFFIVAYNFLSNLSLLVGTSFGSITNLATPDSLITISNISINILPILMTIINIISSSIYSKDYPIKTKIELYLMALIFLVILYNSPSGLVLYWTINNIFSLIKTIINRLKKDNHTIQVHYKRKPNLYNFLLASIVLVVITGILIPSSIIKESPLEFINTKYFVHPLWYIVHSFLISSGLFIIWFGIYYWLSSNRGKVIFECFMWILCSISIINYFCFSTNFGILSSNLIFDHYMNFTVKQILINLIILLISISILIYVFIKSKKLIITVLSIILVSFICMSTINVSKIIKPISKLDFTNNAYNDNMPHFTLSKTGKNVVVIMLDRAMGEYIPYIFNEKPELKTQFSGFTYYSNTLSYGPYTNFATPALYGGYEYTPIELNKRDTEYLVDKQNEALKVLPLLFDSNGYDVTVFDPTYANYNWHNDTSIYYDYPSINKYTTNGYFTSSDDIKTQIENRNRNFFCYSLTKIMPLFTQKLLYDNGNYNQIEEDISKQIIESPSKAYGLDIIFLNSYYVLQNMSNMTYLSNDNQGTFLMMSNDTTHEVVLLDETSYTPKNNIDNTNFDENNKSRFTINGQTLIMEDEIQYAHYESNMTAMIELGKWLDYLKEMNVYDNTRIILVSDHGKLGQLNYLNFDFNAEIFFPLLMVKDFNATEFSTSNEFMTNADVPTLAVENLIENPINPMTGKLLTNIEKTSHEQYVIDSDDWDTDINNGTTFLPATWYSVHDNIYDENNWTLIGKNIVLPQDLTE